MAKGGADALRFASEFFLRRGPVHETVRQLAHELDRARVAYAVIGGMALVAHGYVRTTLDVNVLVTSAGLKRTLQELLGRGYTPAASDRRSLLNGHTGVRIGFVVAGEFPGDGKPKPVAFPHPEDAATVIDGVRYVALHKLVELKLASGLSNPGRLRDLADVQELIRTLRLGDDFAAALDPSVRDKFTELRRALEGSADE